MTAKRSDDRKLIGKLILLACCMFGFGYLLVPLYDVFCEITGIGGRTADTAVSAPADMTADTSRTIQVEFIASLNEYAPWEFRPVTTTMAVHPGRLYSAAYFARNLTERKLVGQAVPSVAPGQAAQYFQKTECFCFTSQEFAAGEGREMPLQFIVDPELPAYIDRLTLSYTFFVTPQQVSARSETDAAAGS